MDSVVYLESVAFMGSVLLFVLLSVVALRIVLESWLPLCVLLCEQSEEPLELDLVTPSERSSPPGGCGDEYENISINDRI